MLVKMKPYRPSDKLRVICTKEQLAAAMSEAIKNAWRNKKAKMDAGGEDAVVEPCNFPQVGAESVQ